MSIHAANGNLAPAPGEYLLGRFAGKQWMKPPEVAELLGRGTQFVYGLIEAGKLLVQAPEGRLHKRYNVWTPSVAIYLAKTLQGDPAEVLKGACAMLDCLNSAQLSALLSYIKQTRRDLL